MGESQLGRGPIGDGSHSPRRQSRRAPGVAAHAGDDLILILAGKGHNGEDARTARKRLPDRRVDLLDVKDPKADFSKLEARLSLRPALVIDGLFGIGLNRPLDPPWVKFIERINAARLPVLAVDVPSGLNADTGEPQGAAIEATVTLTVGAPKIGLLQEPAWTCVGRLEVANEVGLIPCPLTNDLNWTLPGDFSGFPPPRPSPVIRAFRAPGGDRGQRRLSRRGGARGARRAAGPARAHHVVRPRTDLFSHRIATAGGDGVAVDDRCEIAGRSHRAAVGPGLASPDIPEEVKRSMKRAWRDLLMPVIVDASGLDWLPLEPVPRNAVRVITRIPAKPRGS